MKFKLDPTAIVAHIIGGTFCVLLDCGLDSLCFAILVTRLEDELGFDPFATSDEVQFPVTFGDFVRFYERVPA